MFEELFDAISFVGSWRWPETDGEVTAVVVERIGSGAHTRFHLAVAYKFSVGGDGPYAGESFWEPLWPSPRRVAAARRKFRLGTRVCVRFHPDKPSISKLDRRAWKHL
jgi:hypothetical protein